MVYIIIVNWNGWGDTIECLESVFRLDYPDYRVIVCDNGSSDGSVGVIKRWAEGLLDAWVPPGNPLRRLSHPPVRKPLPYVEYERAAAERGGAPADKGEARLVIANTGDNLGFAGGNNVGLRYALARGDFDYVWLLNNDTVVEPKALTHLIDRMGQDASIGMCGSTTYYYDRRDILWARGGAVYNRWIGYARCVGSGCRGTQVVDRGNIERRMHYVAGSSMAVSRRFLEIIGLMSEEYFLYFEELDWAARAKGRFRLGYAPESVVYHKVGRSTGSAVLAATTGRSQRNYILLNQVRFARKFFPYTLPSLLVSVALQKAVGRWKERRKRRGARS